MPRTSRRSGRSRTGVRLGRPPRPDAGNWEKFYVCLPLDLAAQVRARATETNRSLSSVIGELVRAGEASRLAASEQTL